jgi:NAD(P)-dependent dehydrogenase (short-subunit alcohol dehydrogenase family)
MDLGLAGAQALITGGSKGIGFAVASRLLAEDCKVVLAARSTDALAKASASLRNSDNADVQTVAFDAADAAQRDRLVTQHPDIDILINNAGAIPVGSVEAMDDEHWRAAWDVKVFGYINLTRAFLTAMKRRRKGVIVNVIGVAGERMDSNYAAGCTGNAALMAFTRAVGGTSLFDGVRVVGINPGPVSTERLIRLQRSIAKDKLGDPERWPELLKGLPEGRAATPEEIASTVVFLASNLSSYTSGAILNVDGGLSSRSAMM